jgi:hypothetical protein
MDATQQARGRRQRHEYLLGTQSATTQNELLKLDFLGSVVAQDMKQIAWLGEMA